MYALKKRNGPRVWAAAHTQLLNDVVIAVSQRLALGLVDTTREAMLHVGVQEGDYAAVMVQGDRVVAMIDRSMTVMEQSWTLQEQWVAAACWAVKRLAHHTLYVPQLELAVPGAVLLTKLRFSELHSQLAAMVLEL